VYITQADPGGSFPAWIVNVVTKVLAPKVCNQKVKLNLLHV
jgi:hypothetical protein